MTRAGLHRRSLDAARNRSNSWGWRLLAFLVIITAALITGFVFLQPQLRTQSSTAMRQWTFDDQASVLAVTDFDVVYRGQNPRPLNVSSSGLTQPPSGEGPQATYLQYELPGPVIRMGVTASFPSVTATSPGGTVVLSSGNAAVPTEANRFDSDFPNLGIHFAFNAHSWLMAVWRHDGGQEILGTGSFAAQLIGDRSVEILRDGATVTIALPDGGSRSFRDDRIGEWSGKWAGWQLYEKSANDEPAVVRRLWTGWGGA